MIRAMEREMEIRDQTWTHGRLHSMYFGGGTPSLLSPDDLERLIEKARRLWSVDPEAEVTLEANPDDVTPEKAQAWRRLGINRLSLGLQSGRDEKLAWMNRVHNRTQAAESVHVAREAGFSNLTVDLMYQFPGDTPEALAKELDWIIGLGPDHISAYGLTLEPETVFGRWQKKGKLAPLPDELAAAQFFQVREALGRAGFIPYEVSNFALPGKEAVHNQAYWFQKPFLGIGPGAFGLDGRMRSANRPHNPGYIRSLLDKGVLFEEREELTHLAFAHEMLLTRLRTRKGLDLQDVMSETGVDLYGAKSRIWDEFLERDLLRKEESRFFLSPRGLVVADRLTLDLMLDE